MSANALAKLNRAISDLELSLAAARASGKTNNLPVKSEIEACIQRLDEIRHGL